MDALFDHLASISDRPLGTVVHVGAGDGRVLECYAKLAPVRVVLIEGDTQTSRVLRQRASAWPWATVVEKPVAVSTRPLPWHRYNLSTLNGPLDALALGDHYPRLQRLEAAMVLSVAFEYLLAELKLTGCDEHIHALVLDVAGQEDGLLASLSDQTLSAFEVVLLRGCRVEMPSDGGAARRAVERLSDRCFQILRSDSDDRALWPVVLMRLDPVRWQAVQLQRRIDAMGTMIRQRDERIAELQITCTTLSASADASQKMVSDGQRRIEELTDASATQARAAAQCAMHLQVVEQRLVETEQALVLRDATIAEMRRSMEDESALSTELGARLRTIEQAKAAAEAIVLEREAQLVALNHAKLQAEATSARHAAQIEQLTLAHEASVQAASGHLAELQSLRQVCSELEKSARKRQIQIEALSHAKALAERTAAEREAQCEHLARANDALTASIAEGQMRLLSVQGGLAEVERTALTRLARIDALDQALASKEAATQELVAKMEKVTTERDELATRIERTIVERDELAAKVERATVERDELAMTIERTTVDRDQLAAMARELQTQVKSLEQSATELDMAVRARDERIASLMQEVAEANSMADDRNGQLDLLNRAQEQQSQIIAAQDVRLESLASTLAQVERSAQDRLQVMATLDEAKRAAEAKGADLALEIERLTRERDELIAQSGETQGRLLDAQRAVAEGERTVSGHAQQIETLRAAMLAMEKAAAEREALVERLDRERIEQSARREEVAKWAERLKAEMERLTGELGTSRAECETSKHKVDALEAANATLTAQIADRDARQALLDLEVQKAEAQLELIKDVLIREKNF